MKKTVYIVIEAEIYVGRGIEVGEFNTEFAAMWYKAELEESNTDPLKTYSVSKVTRKVRKG